MNEDPSRRRLGRGLAALIGEMDRPAAGEGSRRRRCRRPRADRVPVAQPAQSAPQFRRRRARPIWRSRSASTASCSRSWCARRRAGRYEIIAGERRWRAAQRAGLTRDPGHRARRQRPHRARTRDHRERPARRPQSGRGGARLPAADRRAQLHAGRSRPGHRQEPQPCRQHAAAAEAAGRDPRHAGRRRAVGRPCPHAGHGRRSGGAGQAHRRGRAFGAPGRGAGAAAGTRTTNGRASAAAGARRMPTRWRWKSCCRT